MVQAKDVVQSLTETVASKELPLPSLFSASSEPRAFPTFSQVSEIEQVLQFDEADESTDGTHAPQNHRLQPAEAIKTRVESIELPPELSQFYETYARSLGFAARPDYEGFIDLSIDFANFMVIFMNRFNANKSKVNLKLASGRLKLLRQKKTTLNEHMKREIADLLAKKKEESARIKVEHVIREDFNMEAMEILELYCELLLARFGLLESMQHCDTAIAEAVNTIIYAAPRSEVKELYELREQFIKKYGRDFAMAAQENRNDVVNSRIIAKLKVQTPDPLLVNQYLKAIAESYHVEWDGDSKSDALIGFDSALFNPELGAGEGSFQVPYTYPQQFPQQQVKTGIQYGGDRMPTVPGAGPSPSPSSVPYQPQPTSQLQPSSQQPRSSYANPVIMPPHSGSGGGNRVPSPFRPEDYNNMQPNMLPTSMMGHGAMQTPNTRPARHMNTGNIPQQQYGEQQASPSLPNFPSIPATSAGTDHKPVGGDDGDLPDFDELTRRFEALKRKK
ncbi:hypothetical protein SeLEV6574_g03448 [Synchytrium endobioticum]|uniref:Uncharacterized protein n=1 Tax=Synchytrium endobioticum TaxID=286115 RepID=A0A507D3H7_9FUNG|nr:hypothetical protein SeLEV6574_g03448 [Synchytrium endobioticum]